VLFQLLVPGLTPVSLLESELGFEIAKQLYGHRKATIFTSIVYAFKRVESHLLTFEN
jgi:hypothetical protein